jgi:tetratricopeptide (TPR) repeat protein
MKPLPILFLITFILQAQTKSEEKLLELVHQKIKEGKYSEANKNLSQLIQTNPSLAEAYTLRGRIDERTGQYEKALTDYGIALALMPNEIEANFNRGVAAYRLKRFDLAKPDFKKVLSIKSTETNTIYFRSTNNESTDKIFTAQSSISDLVYNYLGLIETSLKQYDSAIFYFNSAISINANADYYAHRGLAYQAKGDHEKALLDFNHALQLEPGHAVSKNNLAALKKKEGNYADAEKLLMEAKSSNPKAPNHFSDIAMLQMENGRYKEAILNFDSAITNAPKDGELYLNRGLAKEKSKDLDGAMRDFEIALRIDDQWPKAWFAQGNIFMKKKMWTQAVENYSAAITFSESYALAYHNRAIANYHLGKLTEACKDIRFSESLGIKVDSKLKERCCGK